VSVDNREGNNSNHQGAKDAKKNKTWRSLRLRGEFPAPIRRMSPTEANAQHATGFWLPRGDCVKGPLPRDQLQVREAADLRHESAVEWL